MQNCISKAAQPSLRVLLYLLILVLLAFSGCSAPPASLTAQPETAALTARLLTAPYALMGPGPSSFTWSPAGAALAYVEPRDGQDVLWLYDAATGSKQLLLDPARNSDNLDLTSAQWSPQSEALLLSGARSLWLLE